MRAIWKGAISFGLVNIPVNLYSGSEDRAISFDYIHKKDNSRIRYARVCTKEGNEVDFKEIVKGYQYKDGTYVLLNDEDFKKADAKKTKSIEIINFVNIGEVQSVFYEKPYYLEPNGSEKAYSILVEAMEKTGKAALARFVLRFREHLALIFPYQNILVLNQLRFYSEIREPDLKKADSSLVKENELQLAQTLIKQLEASFEPEKYHDTYSEELMRIINEKASGRVPVQKGEEPRPTEVEDLLEMLKASIK